MFWKSFSDFISDFIVVAESFYKDFEKFQLYVFPVIVNWAQCNFIHLLYGLQKENLVSFKIS